MPELPEVETVKNELLPYVIGRRVIGVTLFWEGIVRQPSAEEFCSRLIGQGLTGITRRGKYLIFSLTSSEVLVIHLKMTGQLVYPGNGKTSRVTFYLSGGKTLDFNDQRLFAELRAMDDWRSLKFIKGLGPEPFDITEARFKEMIQSKKTKIKPLLMDQTFISGIGNLYAAEALFRARINPKRPANKLSDKELTALFKAIKEETVDIRLTEECLMIPRKSISGIIGIGESKNAIDIYNPCKTCKTTECPGRRA